MAYNRAYSPGFLRLILGAFFILLGTAELFPEISESIFSLNFSENWLYIVFGVAEILCGLLLILGFVMFHDASSIQWGSLIAFIFWVARIVLTRFVWGMTFAASGTFNWYRFIEWGLILSVDLIIGLAILTIMRRYE